MSADTEGTGLSVTTLTAFKRDVLWTLHAGGEQKGVDIRLTLEDYYEKPINHGQLYPNLDDLVDAGFVDKGKIDGRTNSYALTEAGRRALTQRQTWQDSPGASGGEPA